MNSEYDSHGDALEAVCAGCGELIAAPMDEHAVDGATYCYQCAHARTFARRGATPNDEAT